MKRALAIIGAGRVGCALGRELRKRGWKIGAVVTRSATSARAAVQAIGGGRPQAGLSPAVLESDAVLIAAPDRVVEKIAARLAETGKGSPGTNPRVPRPSEMWSGKIVLHTSGSLSHAALASLQKKGAAVGAMHPMQTFGRRGAPDLRGVIFGIDGDRRAVRVAWQIAKSLGGVPVRIGAASKPAYHCAGGFASQNVLVMMEAGAQILMRTGFTRRQAARALLNLAQQTLHNWQTGGPRAAWTGPVPRGDYATVAKHVQVLKKLPKEFLEAYAAATRLGVRVMAKRSGNRMARLNLIFRKRV